MKTFTQVEQKHVNEIKTTVLPETSPPHHIPDIQALKDDTEHIRRIYDEHIPQPEAEVDWL